MDVSTTNNVHAMFYVDGYGRWIGTLPHHCFCFGLCITSLWAQKQQDDVSFKFSLNFPL